VYLPKGEQLTARSRAKAAWLWSGRDATLAGLSAAAMHGALWIDPRCPAELIRRGDDVPGIVLHRDKLADDEVCVVGGMSTTTPPRTAYDLGRRAPLINAVIRLDALAHATGVTRGAVEPLMSRHRGARGIVSLREAVALMDGGAESPQETRTRLMLIARGLPRPQTQIEVLDDYGCVFARLDMGWEQFKVAVEYDGAHHWLDPAQRTWDIDRWAELAAKGWAVIRVSAELLRYRPDVVVDRVVEALRHAGWRGEIRLDARQMRKTAS
jgi:very-short-patch-repair endonuclease